jgi:hypothetical protein
MASTWSALKIELLETGANAGSWGTLTNANLGDAVLGEAITGQATVDFPSDADVTITLTDSATTQAARNLRLNITESSTGIGSVRNLILGSGCQIEKFYLINNTGTGAKTIKNTSGTGISVPAGKATLVYNNGTNVVDAASYFSSLTLGSALPVASGGTGLTSTPANGALDSGNGTGFTRTTLTAGTNVTITNAAGAITIAASGGGASAATPTALGTVYGNTATATTSAFLGYQAGNSNTGSSNTAIGYQSLFSNTSGAAITAVGYYALRTNTATDVTAVGYFALQSNTSGAENSAFGSGSLQTNTTGGLNTGLGRQALVNNTTGSNNTAVGHQALYSNTTASQSTAVGYQAGYTNATASGLTAVGYYAGRAYIGPDSYGSVFVGLGTAQSVTSGSDNTAVGGSALTSLTTGIASVAVGARALQVTTAGRNTAVGAYALKSNTTGAANVAVGNNTLGGNTTGTDNVGIGSEDSTTGYAALANNTTGNYNVAIGHAALRANTTANYNTAVGWKALALSNRTSEPNAANTAIGYTAGESVTTGNQNVYVGARAATSSATSANCIFLGPDAGNFGTAVSAGFCSIYIGVNTGGSGANPQHELVWAAKNAVGKGNATGFIQPDGGGVYQGNNSSTWSTTSDRRLKKNIVDNTVGLDAITSIRVRNFEYRLPEEITELPTHSAIDKAGVQLGVIAQELQAVLPDCVKQESTGVMSVDPDNLIWYAINAIKELKAQNDALKARLDAANL